MNKINILSPEIYNRLSAGEVVENPASIVKELVENSIDAGSDKITVEIINGGIDEITVTDNGVGVSKEELEKVFLPHSTSKISKASDIDNINSLGFRGEAMASISAVAKVKFISKPTDQENAFQINEKNECVPVTANNGTVVKVSNLFYNTPARRKFLRSINTERNSVTEVMQNLIFANPKLNIKYIIDGKTFIDFRGTGLLSAISKIYKIDETNMMPLNGEARGLKITGAISNIKLSKNNKTRQVVVVNGRAINGGVVSFAANEIMSNYLMVGEFPIFVLLLDLDNTKIDVNVHPQKKEIRFEDKSEIILFIKNVINNAMDDYFMKGLPTTISKVVPVDLPSLPILPAGKSFNPENKSSEAVLIKSLDLFNSGDSELKSAPNILSNFEPSIQPVKSHQQSVLSEYDFRILGQVFETYLIINTNNEFMIVDQHAMAERINYDKLKEQIDKGIISSQQMLDPVIINLTPKELSNFEKIKASLNSMGFDCEEFGSDAIRFSAVPMIMSGMGVKEFLRVILSDKDIIDSKLSDAIKDKIASIACKASIKGGEILSDEQIISFIEVYKKSKIIPLCPHGRPILLTYNRAQIEKLFARR